MKNLIFILLLFSCVYIQAQQRCTLVGQIVDEKGIPIPFATLFVPATSASSMANNKGEFFLSVPCNSYKVKFQCLGYESKTVQLSIEDDKVDFKISLKSVAYKLEEVNIDPSSEDPAYNIIRKAIVMAQYYRKQISAYETDLYIRSFYNVEDIPTLVKKLAEADDIAEIQTGNVDETLLHYSFKKPNRVKEKIIARKSGSNDTAKTGSSYVNLSFYNLGGPDIVNPLSRNSFKVYEFEYLSTFFEGSRKVHKIKLSPKRRGNDLMSGILYINDGLWNLNNVDVVLEQQVFTIEYKQRYNEIEPLLWMPTNHKIIVKGSLIGIHAQVQYLANLTNLEVIVDSAINEKIKSNLKDYVDQFEKELSLEAVQKQEGVELSKVETKIEELIYKEELNNREALKLVRLIKKQEREANQKSDTGKTFERKKDYQLEYADSAFSLTDSAWKINRAIPLTQKEEAIYRARDSLNKVKSGDTVHSQNKSILYKIFLNNEKIISKNKQHIFQPKGILVGLMPYFNTVDGFAPEKKIINYEWTDRKGKYINTTPYLSYAVARKTFTGRLELESQYNKEKRGKINFSAGRRTVGFNRDNPISDRLNTIATTFFTGNFKKMYQQDYAKLQHSIDVVNGLTFGLGAEFANRMEMKNNSDYELFSFINREFTPNIPVNAEVFKRPALIESNRALTFTARLAYTPQQFYTFKDNKKQLLNSKYPTFTLDYRKGIEGVLNSQSNYDVIDFSVQQKFAFRLIDEVSYFFEVGKFLSSKNIFFTDYQNFNTTPSFVIDNAEPDGFRLLDYYAFNTSNYYFEGHFSITNDHIVLKYLPLLNRTGLDEKLEFGYLYTDRNIHFYEAGLSLTNIFYLMDAGAFVSFREDQFDSWAIKLSFYFFQ